MESQWEYAPCRYASLSMFGTKSYAQLALTDEIWPKFCSKKQGWGGRQTFSGSLVGIYENGVVGWVLIVQIRL